MELPVDCFKEDSKVDFDFGFVFFQSFHVMHGMTEGFPIQNFINGA